MKHTKGTWKTGLSDSVIIEQKDGSITLVANSDLRTPQEERRANARLMAAAPDLFEALDGLLGYMEGYEKDYNYGKPLAAFELGRRAIAKAVWGIENNDPLPNNDEDEE